MDVLLMFTIQELCVITKTSLDLYLQTCYENSSFMWLITIGFCYASLHFGLVIDFNDEQMTGFLLCSDPEKELPKHLSLLAKKVKWHT